MISSGVRAGTSHPGVGTGLGVAGAPRTGPAVATQTAISPKIVAVMRLNRVNQASSRAPMIASPWILRGSEGVIPRDEGSRGLPPAGAATTRFLLRRNDTVVGARSDPGKTLRVGEGLSGGDQLAATLLLQLLDPLRGVVEETALGLDAKLPGGDFVGHRLAYLR
jgi:hypothetical protein